MAQVVLVEKKARLSLFELVRFQVLAHCYLNKITVSQGELDSLAFLYINPNLEINDFCKKAVDAGFFKNPQSVRNCLVKLEKTKFIKKTGKNRKTVTPNEDLKIFTQGNICLNLKFLHVAGN